MNVVYGYCSLLFYTFISLTLVGFVTHSEKIMALAASGAGITYGVRDYCDPRPHSLTVMSFYAGFGALWFGVSNYLGFVSEGTIFEDMFFDFEVRDFFFEAQLLATVALILPLLTYDVIGQTVGRKLSLSVPRIGFPLSDRMLLKVSIGFLFFAWVPLALELRVAFLGMLAALITIGSYISIFTICNRWLTAPAPSWPRWTRLLPFLLAVGEAGYFAVYGAERARVAWPLVAVVIPYILHRRINLRRALVGVMLFLAFAFAFKQLAQTRRLLSGAERIEYTLDSSTREKELIRAGALTEGDIADTSGVMRLMARLSTFNQLSQVHRLTEEEGFYEGETMGYVIYIFIPRALWADKPLVVPGQWFAAKLGRGTRLEGGGFSNAINMTIPGELYLNFGWPGVIIGMMFLTLIYFLFWEAADWENISQNILGYAFAFSLLYQAVFNGSHFGGVVNLILWYLLFLAMTYIGITFIRPDELGKSKKTPFAPALTAPARGFVKLNL